MIELFMDEVIERVLRRGEAMHALREKDLKNIEVGMQFPTAMINDRYNPTTIGGNYKSGRVKCCLINGMRVKLKEVGLCDGVCTYEVTKIEKNY